MNKEYVITVNNEVIFGVPEEVKNDFKNWLANKALIDVYTFKHQNGETIFFREHIYMVNIKSSEKMNSDDLAKNINRTAADKDFINDMEKEFDLNLAQISFFDEIIGDPNESKDDFFKRFKIIIEQLECQKKLNK